MAPPVWSSLGAIWKISRKIEGLFELQTRTTAALEAIETRLRSLEDRMTHLEAGQSQIVVEARGAAASAATALAGSVISDVVTRVTRLEMQLEDLPQRLPPPAS